MDVKSRNRLIFVLVFGVSLYFAVPWIWRSWSGRALPPPNAAQLRDLEKLMELKLPPGARPIAWTYFSALDYYILLKIEIDPSALPALIENSPFSNVPLSSTEHRFYDGVGGAWWDRGSEAQRYIYGQAGLPQGQQYQDRHLDIFVDLDNPDKYIVYLALFTN